MFSLAIRFGLVTLCSVLAFSAHVSLASDAKTQAKPTGDTAQGRELDRKYQNAVAHYDAGQYPLAAAELEELLPHAPNSFEIHELLGLIYASESETAKALQHLERAVQIQPNSAPGRTNFAAALSHAGKTALAGEQFRKALALEPDDYDANHNLGEFYIQTGKIAEAIPFLETAQRVNPASYDNGFDLASADLETGKLSEARAQVESLMKQKDAGELHGLLGEIDEKEGKFMEAVNELETAAHLDPSEETLFAWGSELLLHRTYDPAIQVFQQATKRYPDSPRLQIGLGMALNGRGKYDDAIQSLLTASDLDPKDARCYLFLSKAFDSSPSQADEVLKRFKRYTELEPQNAHAWYYWGVAFWKAKRSEDSAENLQIVETTLKKAIALDDKLAEAHLQLGNLYADRHDYAKSAPQYERALELDNSIADAHYRLGQDYVHTGQKDRAQAEFDVYQRLRAQQLAALDKERSEVQQFVYTPKPDTAEKH